MTAPARIIPIAGKVQAAERVVIVQSIANMQSASFATEIDATTSLYVEAFFRDWAPSGSQENGTAPRRIYDRAQLPSLGQATYEIPNFQYIYRPSEASSTNNNKAYSTLTAGLSCYAVRRLDKDRDIALAAGDFVSIYHIRLGVQFEDRSGDGSDAFAEYQITQAVELLEPPAIKVAIAA